MKNWLKTGICTMCLIGNAAVSEPASLKNSVVTKMYPVIAIPGTEDFQWGFRFALKDSRVDLYIDMCGADLEIEVDHTLPTGYQSVSIDSFEVIQSSGGSFGLVRDGVLKLTVADDAEKKLYEFLIKMEWTDIKARPIKKNCHPKGDGNFYFMKAV